MSSPQVSALRYRDSIADIAKTVLDNERPSSIRASVVSFDSLNKTAQVLQPGETEPLSVSFSSANQPLVVGEVVELAGTAGNRYINTRVAGPYIPSKLLGGGAITWSIAANVGHFSWSMPFTVNIPGAPVALGAPAYAPDGYFTITKPPSGVLIPTYRFIDADTGYVWGTTTVGADIPLAAYQTLYYALPLGSVNASDPAQFYIVDRGAPMSIPRHWVKMCFFNFDGIANASATADLGTGYPLDHWRIPQLVNLWHDYGSGFYGAGYRKEGPYVKLRGAIAGGSAVMFNLPLGFRPQGGGLSFPANSISGTTEIYGRVDVATTGDVRAFGGSTTYFSLNTVHFLAEQ